MNEATLKKIKALDEKLNQKLKYQSDDLITFANNLFSFGHVEVGWRESCGTTDNTAKTYSEWKKVVKILRKNGFKIDEERVKHGNAYATSKGGFWHSIIYKLNT